MTCVIAVRPAVTQGAVERVEGVVAAIEAETDPLAGQFQIGASESVIARRGVHRVGAVGGGCIQAKDRLIAGEECIHGSIRADIEAPYAARITGR